MEDCPQCLQLALVPGIHQEEVDRCLEGIVLFKNEPIYRHPISAARVEALLCRKNRDVYGATISSRREVGGRKITVDRHLNQLFPFLGIEQQLPQETIPGLAEDPVAEDLAPDNSTQHISAQDEFHTDPANPDQ